MIIRLTTAAALALAMAAHAAPAAAQAPAPAQASANSNYERDRQAILAMAGEYRVRFDFREGAAFVPGYEPLEPKRSGGFEVVRVLADRPGFISLQHTLVADIDGKPHITKHWRQDWTYEPKEVLVYESAGLWKLKPVPAAEAKGAWSQTVWQTDDSPRYGGVGRWAYDRGATRWVSDLTLRPLARRDAVRSPPYSWYEGQNRHALTPSGWVHEQDNAKLGVKDGQAVTYVHEDALNAYVRFSDFNAKAADDYWAKTGAYWAAVRGAWDEAIRADQGVRVGEEPQFGSVTGPRLMGLADEVAEGELAEAEAISQARAEIVRATR